MLWINDGATANNGFIKVEGVDFNVSYDFDLGEYGAWNTGITGTYYLHQFGANNSSEPTNPAASLIQDLYHTTLGAVGGVQQVGAESLPKLRYRARLGWADGPWSVTGFMDYQAHFFHTQNAPPNVNNQCLAAGGTVGGAHSRAPSPATPTLSRRTTRSIFRLGTTRGMCRLTLTSRTSASSWSFRT